MNPLFNLLGGNMPIGNMGNMIEQFNQFKKQFRGDPQQEVMKLVQSGKISQSQLNQLQSMAQQLRSLFNN